MSKLNIAILLIVFGTLAILAALYWTFAPVIKTGSILPNKNQPSPAAPESPEGDLKQKPPASLLEPPAKPVAREVSSEEQAQLVLRQQALSFAARQGTYANADGFFALQEVYPDATLTLRAFFEAEQLRLTKEHPSMVSAWLQTTKALSARFTSDLPLAKQKSATVVVQAQQIIETGQKSAVISYHEITITFTLTQGRWLVARVASKPLDL